MATKSDIPVIIGSQFISPNPLELKIESFSVGKLVVTDINNKIILKVKPCDSTFHRQRWIVDANDIPIVKIQEKNLTAHDRWNVYMGQSQDEKDIIFTARNSHMIQFKTCVKVYLGSKKSCNDDYDFQIKGKWSKKSLSICKRNSSKEIAQTNKVQPLKNKKAEEDSLMVTIEPNVDYAFVVALIAIVDAMNCPDPKKAMAVSGLGGAINIMSFVPSS